MKWSACFDHKESVTRLCESDETCFHQLTLSLRWGSDFRHQQVTFSAKAPQSKEIFQKLKTLSEASSSQAWGAFPIDPPTKEPLQTQRGFVGELT